VIYEKTNLSVIIIFFNSRFTWVEAFRLWLPSVPWHELVVMTNGKEFIEDANILVISYDLLTRHKEILEKMKFGMLILVCIFI